MWMLSDSVSNKASFMATNQLSTVNINLDIINSDAVTENMSVADNQHPSPRRIYRFIIFDEGVHSSKDHLLAFVETWSGYLIQGRGFAWERWQYHLNRELLKCVEGLYL
jgi:hypothetical protein